VRPKHPSKRVRVSPSEGRQEELRLARGKRYRTGPVGITSLGDLAVSDLTVTLECCRDLGSDWHARHTDRSRKARNARRQLEALGYDVIITLREDAA
jgi:hypothetical protein